MWESTFAKRLKKHFVSDKVESPTWSGVEWLGISIWGQLLRVEIEGPILRGSWLSKTKFKNTSCEMRAEVFTVRDKRAVQFLALSQSIWAYQTWWARDLSRCKVDVFVWESTFAKRLSKRCVWVKYKSINCLWRNDIHYTNALPLLVWPIKTSAEIRVHRETSNLISQNVFIN